MYYTIYKITNRINGKIYIGAHKTKDINDKYMGSGKYLLHAQTTYGLENFTKEILFVFDNPEEMYAKEAEIVNKDFISEENTYNIKVGGFGGWDHINKNNPYHSVEHCSNISPFGKQDFVTQGIESEWFKKGGYRTKELGVGICDPKNRCDTTGFKHSEETKKKISIASSLNQSGSKNSQFGKPKHDRTKNKISETLKNKPQQQCPHCKKQSNNRGMLIRWHFDNCKQK